MKKNSYWLEFSKGFFKENPIFVIMLGLCPTLAVSIKVENAFGMGLGVIFVLLGSNVFISLLRNFIPDKVRIPAYIVVIASFVTIVDLVMQAYTPDLYKALGVYVKLIVVNCIILGRAEAFANRNTVGRSVLDALGMGLGFTLSLAIISAIREGLGDGQLTFSKQFIVPMPWKPIGGAKVLVYAAGALLLMGFLLGLINWFKTKRTLWQETWEQRQKGE